MVTLLCSLRKSIAPSTSASGLSLTLASASSAPFSALSSTSSVIKVSPRAIAGKHSRPEAPKSRPLHEFGFLSTRVSIAETLKHTTAKPQKPSNILNSLKGLSPSVYVRFETAKHVPQKTSAQLSATVFFTNVSLTATPAGTNTSNRSLRIMLPFGRILHVLPRDPGLVGRFLQADIAQNQLCRFHRRSDGKR